MTNEGTGLTSAVNADAAPAIITLTLAPARDLTITAEKLVPGTSHRVPPTVGKLGGKGINVARVLAALDYRAYAQGPAPTSAWPQPGPDISAPVWDLTPTSANLRSSYAIVEDSGRATVLNESAREHPPEVWCAITDAVQRRLREPGMKVLAISGSTPSDLPRGFYRELISAAGNAGVATIVDTSGEGLIAAAEAGADWVKPNDEELRDVCGHEDWATSAGELIRLGTGRVLVSRGHEGMALVDESGPGLSARLPRVLQGNPTGAGDATVAALAWQLAEHAGTRSILAHAVGISASAVLMPQAGQIHPSWPQLRDEVNIQPLQEKPKDHARGGQ